MADPLPRLRFNLDFMPSPDPERPGLYIRDPYHYTDATLLVPPELVEALECFDGQQTGLDLRSELVRITGQIQVGELEQHLFETLDEAGFLENDRYREMRGNVERKFAEQPIREAAFADSAYPANRIKLADLLTGRVGGPQGDESTVAIAAPHASPDGGWDSYQAAYRALPHVEAGKDKTFVILGTSHYGAPQRFGLTRKRFQTPFGLARNATDLVDELEKHAPGAVRMEDYCHAVEHSIEFQVVFLQHLYGADVKVLPILCGPFVKSIYEGGLPEDNEEVRRFLEALSEIGAREGKRLRWVLGVDMAHMGQRYGDPLSAQANQGEMVQIADRDHQRIEQINCASALHYWSLIQERQDDMKWCGSAPFYTFLRAMPGLQGDLLSYQHWQIDPHSVVSFAGMQFRRQVTADRHPTNNQDAFES